MNCSRMSHTHTHTHTHTHSQEEAKPTTWRSWVSPHKGDIRAKVQRRNGSLPGIKTEPDEKHSENMNKYRPW